MLRINKQGFTLIELMVVIVIIGVLASLAIPRFTEASAKAKMGEAPRIIASFESGFLATVAEKGFPLDAGEELMVKIDTASNWFKYRPDVVTGTLTAESIKSIGAFPQSGQLVTTYSDSTETFEHTLGGSADSATVANLIPSFASTLK
jgi:prepilin-type N-terminal cleavage/methylation domain-containing protein